MSELLLLRESFSLCPDNMCSVRFLTESEKREMSNNEALYLVGVFQRADAINGNSRIYRRSILEREVENYQKVIRERRSVGCTDHSDSAVVELERASHMIVQLWWEGNDLMGKTKILSTDHGKNLKAMINDGVQLCVSSRSLGSLKQSIERPGVMEVNEDLQILCWDIVQEPSTERAFINPIPVSSQMVKESVERIYTKSDRINRLMNDILWEN